MKNINFNLNKFKRSFFGISSKANSRTVFTELSTLIAPVTLAAAAKFRKFYCV